MPKYPTTWVDYRLASGQEFSVAVCGYTGRVRHMFIGNDILRRMMIRHVYVDNDMCQASEHCLALDCPLNRSEREHLLHMLDMQVDEVLDDEQTANQLGTVSTLDALLNFAHKMNEALPEELKKRLEPEKE
jgi:hypothetical protein